MDQRMLMRAVERESGNFHGELSSVAIHHMVGADHEAAGGGQGSATGIFIAFTWFENGLIADDSLALDFLNSPLGVGDPPVTRPELDGALPLITDGNMIGPDIASVFRHGFFFKKGRLHADCDVICRFMIQHILFLQQKSRNRKGFRLFKIVIVIIRR